MTTDRRALLDTIAATLDGADVPHALIGASALAIHGISRSTMDVDLLVTDSRVLSPPFWSGLPPHIEVDVRRGDATDPLAGVIRFRADGERDVDIVVGRAVWQADAIARAEPSRPDSTDLRTVRVDDLVLLKLFAGGSQDRWDIEQVLALPGRDAVVAAVDSHLSALPEEAQRLWTQLKDV